MKNKTIHVVSLDVPFPPDYGGMIDVFYRLKALRELGFEIILHSFTYGRGTPSELQNICKEVHFYNRKRNIFSFFSKVPFVVKTRISKALLTRLQGDNHPILLEGLHCCWVLEQFKNTNRIVVVRTHNIEHEYYRELSQSTSGLKRFFFQSEARKLKKYESVLQFASGILAIQSNDLEYFKKVNSNTFLLPASFPKLDLIAVSEVENYCLFHGNLSVQEVHDSAMWLLTAVIPLVGTIPFKIAGKNPSEVLIAAAQRANVELIANPNQEQMERLILNAKLHTLPTTQDTGLKLKLLMALQCIGKTVVNSNQLAGNTLGEFCIVADSAKDFSAVILREFWLEVDFSTRKLAIESFKKSMDAHDQLRYALQTLGIV